MKQKTIIQFILDHCNLMKKRLSFQFIGELIGKMQMEKQQYLHHIFAL